MRSIKEMDKRLDEREQEIERLNKAREIDIEYNKYLQKELAKSNNIIKEVREYIENYPTLRYSSMDNSNGNRLTGKLIPTDKLLEILDKER